MTLILKSKWKEELGSDKSTLHKSESTKVKSMASQVLQDNFDYADRYDISKITFRWVIK